MAKALRYLDEVQDGRHGNGLYPMQPMHIPDEDALRYARSFKRWHMFATEDVSPEFLEGLRRIGSVTVIPRPDWDVKTIYEWKAAALSRLPLLRHFSGPIGFRELESLIILGGGSTKGMRIMIAAYKKTGIIGEKFYNGKNKLYVKDIAFCGRREYFKREALYAKQPPGEAQPFKTDRPKVSLQGLELQIAQHDKWLENYEKGMAKYKLKQERLRVKKEKLRVAGRARGFPGFYRGRKSFAQLKGLPEPGPEQTDSQPHGPPGTPADAVPLHLPAEDSVSLPAGQPQDGTVEVAPIVEQGSLGVEAGGREAPPQDLGDAGEVGDEAGGDAEKLVGEVAVAQEPVPLPVTGDRNMDFITHGGTVVDGAALPSDPT